MANIHLSYMIMGQKKSGKLYSFHFHDDDGNISLVEQVCGDGTWN